MEGDFLNEPPGALGWLLPRDHKRLALLHFVYLNIVFAVGGALALLLRVHLFNHDSAIVAPEVYGQVFTLHGALMMLVFALPAIPATLGNFVIPLQVGLRAAALRWAGVAGLYIFVVSAGAVVIGSRMQPDQAFGVTPPLVRDGVVGLALAAGLTALSLVATILRGRRLQKLRWRQMSLFVLASLIGAIATLIAGGLWIFAVKTAELQTFEMLAAPALAAIPGLALVPALGVVCELLGVHARGLVIRGGVVAALIVLAVVALPVWQMAGGAALAEHVGRVAVLLLLGAWSVPVFRGRKRASAPLLYAVAAIVTLLVVELGGGLIAAMDEVASADTYLVVGHMHLRTLVIVLAWLGGLHHWWPKLTGRLYSEAAGRVGAVLVAGGALTHGVAALVLGHEGMPRRYFTYLAEFTELQRVASVGAFVTAAGLVWTFGYLVHALVRGAPAGEDPWHARTPEWQTASPPPAENFVQSPKIADDPYPRS